MENIKEKDIQKAVDETIKEMNDKIKELNEFKDKDNHNENKINDAINYLRNNIDSIKAYYESIDYKFKNEDIIVNLKYQSRNIYNEIIKSLENAPNVEEIKQLFINKIKEIDESELSSAIKNIDVNNIKSKVGKGIDKLNHTTDTILYAARDLYDEYNEKPEVKKAVNTIKDTSKDLFDSFRKIVSESLKNKG